MEFPLNIPAGKRQRDFLDHLNAALRQRTGSFSGDASVDEHGQFQSTMAGPFPVGADFTQLRWRLTKDAAGTLLKVDVISVDPTEQRGWETAASEFVTWVLAAAFVERRQQSFVRTFFYYIGPQLDGEYWLPGYRFGPAYPQDPQP